MKHVVNDPNLVKCELGQRGDLICLIGAVGDDDEGNGVLCGHDRENVVCDVLNQKDRGFV
jgi:hypothetical protein